MTGILAKTEGVRDGSVAMIDVLPRPLRVAMWEAVQDQNGMALAGRFLALQRRGMTADDTAEVVAVEVRRDDARVVGALHQEMRLSGRGGSPHVLAVASILRDAARPARRITRRNRGHHAPITFCPENTSQS